MKVIHCPSCGSDNIDRSSYSAEYMSSIRWTCGDCDWSYKKGSGMGTGSGNSGVHPRDAGPSKGQSTLVEVGQYCRNCETVIIGSHGCTAHNALIEMGVDSATQEDVLATIKEYKYSAESQLIEDIERGNVILTPTFYHVSLPDDSVLQENIRLVRQEIEQLSQEPKSPGEQRAINGKWMNKDANKVSRVDERMGAENKIERAFISRCIDELDSQGIVHRIMNSVKLP